MDNPLVDVALMLRPAIRGVVTALVLTGVVLAGTALWVSQVLQSALGLGPVTAALAIAPMGLGIAVGTCCAPALAKRLTPHTVAVAGMLVSAVGSLLLMLVSAEHDLPLLIASFTLTAAGCGPLFAFGTNTVITASPPEAAGRAAGLTETGNYLGSSLGVAVLGTIGATVYSDALQPAVQNLPSTLRQAVLQNMAQAQSIAHDHAPALIGPIDHAGVQGLHAVGTTAAVPLLICTTAVRHLQLPEADSSDAPD